jgi:hypothetical protein
MSTTAQPLTAAEWDAVRDRFRHSMMARTEIFKLAQNLDLSWPLRGRDEVPLKYLPLTLEEMKFMPGIGEHPDRLRLLVEILNETMAFDDPFGDMAEHVDSSSKKDDGSQRALEKLGIPLDFPLELCALTAETRDFCRAEGITTLGHFIEFGSNMAQNIVVGGEFRAFLNAVAQSEEAAIARHLPFRPGRQGLHFPESAAQVLSHFDRSERLFILESAQAPITAEDRRETAPLPESRRIAVRDRIRQQYTLLFDWFGDCRPRLEDAFAEGPQQVERLFMPLENPVTEKACRWMCAFVLGLDAAPQAARRGFFARLFGRKP